MADAAEPIDELTVKLGLDSSEFAAAMDKTMSDAEARASAAAQNMAKKVSSGIAQGAVAPGGAPGQAGAPAQMTQADFQQGAAVVQQAAQFQVPLEKAAEDMSQMAMGAGKSKEELLALAQAALQVSPALAAAKDKMDALAQSSQGMESSKEKQLAFAQATNDLNAAAQGAGASISQMTTEAQQNVADATDAFQKEADAAGLAVSPEILEGYEKESAKIEASTKSDEDKADMQDDLRERTVKYLDVMHEVSDILDDLLEKYKQMHGGEDMPFKETERFKSELEGTAKAGLDLGASTEQIKGQLHDVGDELNKGADAAGGFNEMIQRVTNMGISQLLRRFSPILLGFKAIQAVIKEVQADLKAFDDSLKATFQESQNLNQLAAQGVNMGTPAQGMAANKAIASAVPGTTTTQVAQLETPALFQGANLNMTKDQIDAVTEASLKLAKATGGDAKQAMDTLFSAIKSGNVDALQPLLGKIDEATLYNQALTMGLIHEGETLDTANASLATQAIYVQTATDRYKAYEASLTPAEKAQEEMTNKTNDSRVAVGALLEPWGTLVNKGGPMTTMLDGVAAGMKLVDTGVALLVGSLLTLITEVMTFGVNVDMILRKQETWEQGAENIAKAWSAPGFVGAFENSFGAIMKELVGTSEQSTATATTSAQSLEAIAAHTNGVGAQIAAEWNQITEAHAKESDKIVSDYEDSIKQIESDTAQAESDAKAKEATDLANLQKNYQDNAMKAAQTFYTAEVQAAQDHARTMERMEEDAQTSLEGAVRNRDAASIRQIQDKYNTDKTRAEEDYKTTRDRQEQAYAQQRQDALKAYNQSVTDRQNQLATDLALIQKDEQTKEDAATKLRDKQLADLKQTEQDEMDAWFKTNKQALTLSGDQLDALHKQLEDALGPGGWAETLWERYLKIIQGVYESIPGAASEGTSSQVGQGQGEWNPYTTAWYQSGGSFIATAPMKIGVGEVPEQVDITPLSRMGSRGGQGAPGAGGRSSVSVAVQIGLDEGLVGQVVDQSLQGVADVMVEVQKARK